MCTTPIPPPTTDRTGLCAPTRQAVRLSAEGVCLRLEGVTRELQRTGRLAQVIHEVGACAAAVQPAAVSEALRRGDAYRAHLADLASRRVSTGEAVHSLLCEDARTACDTLLPHHSGSGGLCARVFVPLDPCADARRAVAEASAMRWTVDRPNAVFSVHPALDGVALVGDLLARGIGVDVRSLFSLEQFDLLFEEFLTGLERARAAGHDPAGIHFTASVPLRLLDESIAARLGPAGPSEDWAVAIARLLHHRREQLMDGARWRSLVRAGARPLHFVWSSPEAPVGDAVHYLEELVAWNSAFSAGPGILHAVRSRAELRGDTVSGTEPHARRVLSTLRRHGVDVRLLGRELQQAQLTAARAEWTELCRAVGEALGR
ncbi:transaldolase family protein [Streptomyces sp. NPDC000594]|uniref:transaldolase family protein n=1 Tax=Streptomyces sp. NPDC000594 TaxID=3154261 RepID=UPI00331D0E69